MQRINTIVLAGLILVAAPEASPLPNHTLAESCSTSATASVGKRLHHAV